MRRQKYIVISSACFSSAWRHVDAVFTSEAYGSGFASHLAHRFRRRDPAAPVVSHVCVDPGRLKVPVSGSVSFATICGSAGNICLRPLRSRWCNEWQFWVASLGKSTLAIAMARELSTASVAEYGRELWMARAGSLQFDDFAVIAQEQIKREESSGAMARRWLFCDTSPLRTLFYCVEQFGQAAAELQNAAGRCYEHVILCAPDFPFVQDGTRQDAEFRDRQHAWYERQPAARGVNYLLATGSLAERVEMLVDHLKNAERSLG